MVLAPPLLLTGADTCINMALHRAALGIKCEVVMTGDPGSARFGMPTTSLNWCAGSQQQGLTYLSMKC